MKYTDLIEFKEILSSVGYENVTEKPDEKYKARTYFVETEEDEKTGKEYYKLVWTTEKNKYNSYTNNVDFFMFFDENEKRISDVN